MNGIYGSFEQAVQSTSEVFRVTGRVLPVTNENIQLCATFTDGSTICGEWEIVQASKTNGTLIQRVYLEPSHPKALPEALEAIEKADVIILGPGSLYTSIIPNLLVDGITEAICNARGIKVYISNIMTHQEKRKVMIYERHIQALEEHGISNVIQYVIVNNKKFPKKFCKFTKKMGLFQFRIK